MALRDHSRKGLVVGRECEHAGGERQANREGSRYQHVYHGPLVGGDSGERYIKAVAPGPEFGKVFLPLLDDLGGLYISTFEAHTVGLLPHLAETLQWAEGQAPLHVQIQRSAGNVCYFERRALAGPVSRVTWLRDLFFI